MKDFFERLNALGKPKRPDIIEKDFHLHRLLDGISRDDYLGTSLSFKGGTCLIKAYMGYYRFSEDVDFTWRVPSIWRDRSPSEAKRRCSLEINRVVERFKAISVELGLRFKGNKADPTEVHISSGGRMALLFLGYSSEVLDAPASIKVEVNFVENVLFPFRDKGLHSYVESLASEETAFLYEKPWEEYSSKISLTCYDPREIFVEKCRAALTRKAYKLRDVIDLHYMARKYGYTIGDFKPQIVEKVEFMLDLYGRYKENMEFSHFPPAAFSTSEETKLLLDEPCKDLSTGIEDLHRELEELKAEMMSQP